MCERLVFCNCTGPAARVAFQDLTYTAMHDLLLVCGTCLGAIVIGNSGYSSSIAAATVPSHVREMAPGVSGANEDFSLHPLGQTVNAARHTPLPLSNGDLVLRMNASQQSGLHSTEVATFAPASTHKTATSDHTTRVGQRSTSVGDEQAHSRSSYAAMSVSTKQNPSPPPPHPSLNDQNDAGTLSVSQLSSDGHAQVDESASGVGGGEDVGRSFGATPTIPVSIVGRGFLWRTTG